MNEITSLMKDKLMTEQFILNFLVYSSSILIFVLNELTYSQQILYNKIKKLSIGKKLIVIHNLKNYGSKKQVLDYIEETLSCAFSFKLQKYKMLGKNSSNKNTNFYIDQNNYSKNQNILHFFMAHEKDEAGDYYNISSINQIKDIINTCHDYQKFDIREKLADFLVLYSDNLFKFPIKRENIDFSEKFIKIKKENLELTEWENKNFFFKKKKNSPKYRYYKSENNQFFYIEFIICGILKKLKYSIELKKGSYIFHINGIKSLINEEEGFYLCKSDSGYFEFDIQVPIDEIYLKDTKIRNRTMYHGIITLEFALQNINQEENEIILLD